MEEKVDKNKTPVVQNRNIGTIPIIIKRNKVNFTINEIIKDAN